MTEKKITVCDGCEKEIDLRGNYHLRDANRKRLYLETSYFWDGVESTTHLVELDFCEKCARDIKSTLKKIAEQLKDKK